MKKVTLPLLLFCLALLVGACSKENYESLEKKTITYTLKYEKLNFNQQVQISDAGPILSASLERNVSSFMKDLFSHREFEIVNEVEILFFSKETKYGPQTILTLVAKGQDHEGQSYPIAAEFDIVSTDGIGPEQKAANGGTGTLGDIHSCTGAPCACCEFRKQYESYTNILGDKFSRFIRIVGCSCAANPTNELCPEPEGSCNHTVSTAP